MYRISTVDTAPGSLFCDRSPPVPLMSGYSKEAINQLGNHGWLEADIEKPFTVEGLLQKLQEALRGED